MGDAAVFADEIFGFHVRPAAKMQFKACLAWQGETHPLSHDLVGQSDLSSVGGTDVPRFDGLVDYTRHAVSLRDAAADPGLLDRAGATEQVEA